MRTVQTSFIEGVTLNRIALAKRFKVTRVSYKGWTKEERDARLSTLPSLIYRTLKPLALLQNKKESCYWLLLGSDNTFALESDTLGYREVSFTETAQWILQALLIRAVPRLLSSKQNIKRVEADGMFYIIKQKPLKPWGNELVTATVEPRKIQMLSKWRLNLGTVTFTPLKCHENKSGELSLRVAKLPRYDADQFGQEVTRSQQGQYIKRAWSKFKNRVPALKLSEPLSLETYYMSRLGTLSLFIDDLQRAYGEDFGITLENIDFDEHKHIRQTEATNSYAQIYSLIRRFPLFVVNHSDDLDAAELIRSQLLNLGIKSTSATDINLDGLTIQIVNDKDSYEEDKADPYKIARTQYPEAIIQSCLPKRLEEKRSVKHTVEVLLKELVIKLETQQQKLLINYPELPEEPWFIIQKSTEECSDSKKEKWHAFYCKARKQKLEFDIVPEQILQSIELTLNSEQRKRVFTGKDRPNLVFWPETENFLILNNTEAVCLPNEAELHALIKEVEQTVTTGVPKELIANYCKSFPDSSAIQHLPKINLEESHNIAVSELKKINYRSADNQHFYDYLAEHGYRVKTSLQSKDDGLLSVTSGVLINRAKALYAAGNIGSAQRVQDNFNHIYHVETDLEQVPEWFWDSLEVWHVRHRSTTVYPYIFKHLREYGDRQVLGLNNKNVQNI